ncbi:aspartyl protease family protein [Botrimarina sp.]|uniref:aspartyl protease family protein n=1 Tax=Botrimarina sp. TaxID=2795802 RepID=UPI0032EB4537
MIENAMDREKRIEASAMVDTGATYLTLPESWSDRLGEFEKNETIEIGLADGSTQKARLCGPARITIERFSPIYGEVLFLPMGGAEGAPEPLLGYIPLESSRVAVDMLGHRLVPLKYADLK